MKALVLKLLDRILNRIIKLSVELEKNKAKLLNHQSPRSLYRTPHNDLFWLNETGYLDRNIIDTGVFEKRSTELLPSLVKQGDTVLDIGANIGYYTVLLSKLIGDSGQIYAFEPTKHFGEVLKVNLSENKINNVEVLEYGLSNKVQQLEIDIGPSSATMHSPEGYDSVIAQENIKLSTLEEFIKERELSEINFIKIDVDGHEPLFFEGAWTVLDSFSPIVLCEISHLHYLEAGSTAWDFYRTVRKHNYYIYNEDTMEIMDTETKFLRQCANFDKTSNIILSKKLLVIDNQS